MPADWSWEKRVCDFRIWKTLEQTQGKKVLGLLEVPVWELQCFQRNEYKSCIFFLVAICWTESAPCRNWTIWVLALNKFSQNRSLACVRILLKKKKKPLHIPVYVMFKWFHIYIDHRQETIQMKPLLHIRENKIKSWNGENNVYLSKLNTIKVLCLAIMLMHGPLINKC